MDFVVLALSALIGFAAGFGWVYTRNPFVGIAVIGFGAFAVFGIVTAAGPGPVLEGFAAAVGLGGLVAAVVGGIAGGYAADRARSDESV